MRCAPRRTSLSSSWILVLVVALVIGAALFGIGSAMVRSAGHEITWTRAFFDGEPTEAERREMVERLRLLDDDWAREALARARAEERWL